MSQSKSMESGSSRRPTRRKTSPAASLQPNKRSSIVGATSKKESLEVDPAFWIGAIWRRMFFKKARDFLAENKLLDPPGNALEKFRLAVQSVQHAIRKPMFKTRMHETFLQMQLKVPAETIPVEQGLVPYRTPKETLQRQQQQAVQAACNDAKAALMLQTIHAPCFGANEHLLQEGTEVPIGRQLPRLNAIQMVESAKMAFHQEALDSQLGDCCDRIASLHERSTRDLNLGTKLSTQIQNDILRARRIIAVSSGGEHQDGSAQKLEEKLEHEPTLNVIPRGRRRRQTFSPKLLQPPLDDPAGETPEEHGTNCGKQAVLQPLLDNPARQTPEVHDTNSGNQEVLQPLLDDPAGQTPEAHGTNKQAVRAVLVGLQNMDNSKSLDTACGEADQPATVSIAKICFDDDRKSSHRACEIPQGSSSSSFNSSEDEDELHELGPALPNLVPVLPSGRSRKLRGADGKPTAVRWCAAPPALHCGGCLTKRRGDPDWKKYRNSSSHSATVEAEHLNNNGFGSRDTAPDKQVIQVASEAVAKMPTHPELQQHQVEEDRHSCPAKLSESALAAGVALFLRNASHSTDAVLAALRVAEVAAQSHATTHRLTPGFLPYAKAQPDRPFPKKVSFCEASRTSALALEQNALNPSSSKGEEDTGEKQPYQDPGQMQAAWPHVRAHSPMQARSPRAHRPGSAPARDISSWKSTTETRSWRSPESSRCFDFTAALSKAGGHKDVLGNPFDSMSPRRPRSAQVWQTGSKRGKAPSLSKWRLVAT